MILIFQSQVSSDFSLQGLYWCVYNSTNLLPSNTNTTCILYFISNARLLPSNKYWDNRTRLSRLNCYVLSNVITSEFVSPLIIEDADRE